MSQLGGKRKVAKRKAIKRKVVKRKVAKRKPVKRKPKRKVTKRKPKRRVKVKAKRKPRRKSSSKYSISMLGAPHLGGGRKPAKRKAAKRKAAKRKVVKRKKGRRKNVKRQSRELAMMGIENLGTGMQPALPLHLALDPELRKQVLLADPVSRNMLSKYGPGLEGYTIGMDMPGKSSVVEMVSESPQMGVAMQSRLGLGQGMGLGLGLGQGQGMGLGLGLGRGWGQGPDFGVGQEVQTMDLDRLPGDTMTVTSSGWGQSPEFLTVPGLSLSGDIMPDVGASGGGIWQDIKNLGSSLKLAISKTFE